MKFDFQPAEPENKFDFQPHEAVPTGNPASFKNFDPQDVVRAAQGFNTGVERFTRGVAQPLVEGKEIFGKRFSQASKRAQQEQEQELAKNKEISPFAAGAGELAGSIAPTVPLMFLPGMPGIGTAGRAITQGALQGGLMGGAQYTNQGDSRLQNAALGAGAGAISYPLVKGLGAANPVIKGGLGGLLGGAAGYGLGGTEGAKTGGAIGAALPFVPGLAGSALKNMGARAQGLPEGLSTLEQAAANKLLKGVDLGEAEKGLGAAERLGLKYVTPGEATGSPIPGKAQGAVGRSEEGGATLFGLAKERAASEKDSINKLLNDISPNSEAEKAAENQFYEKAKTSTTPVNTDPVEKLLNDKLKGAKGEVAGALSKVKEYLKPAGAQEGIDTSISGLHQTKMAIDNLMDSASNTGIGRTAQREVKEIQDKLLEQLDISSPEYAAGRAIAKRRFLREDLEAPLDKKEYEGTNFYKANLLSDKRYNEIYSKLKDVPGGQQTLSDMRIAFKDLINSQNARSASGLEKTGMTKGRNMIDSLKDMASNLVSGKFDQASVEIMTNPSKWMTELKKIHDTKNKQMKTFKMGELLAKITPTLTVSGANSSTKGAQ